VLIVDDHDVVGWGFRLVLGAQPWVERCLPARDSEEALRLVAELEPHVAVVDVILGGESGAGLCERLRQVSPSIRVLLVSGASAVSPRAARAAGASGFVAKDASARELAAAVRTVAAGGEAFPNGNGHARERPSPRESEVLALIAAGATNADIADRLHLSPHTVKEYVSGLYRKLGARNRAEAVRRGQDLGLIP
jgi:DNA-binding NarL/FixJ family response regulator